MQSGFVLRSLSLRAVKRFDALELKFEPGLNLVSGANESGKSTVVLALRSVFLERAKSVRVAQMLKPVRTFSEPEVPSQISVSFSFQGVRYQLDKAFAPIKTARLVRETDASEALVLDTLLDEAAEAHVGKIWQASLVDRGASSIKHQGLLGLLWVNQSDLEPAAWNEQAHAMLGAELTRRAQNSVSARQLGVKVDEALAAFLGARGSPVKDYAKALEEHDLLSIQAQQWTQQAEQLRADIDQLNRLVQEEQRLLAGLDKAAAANTAAQRAVLRQWQAQLRSALSAQNEQALALQRVQAEMDARTLAWQRAQKTQARLDQLYAEQIVLRASVEESAERLRVERTDQSQLSDALRAAEAELLRRSRQIESARERQRLSELAARLLRRKTIEAEIAEAQRQRVEHALEAGTRKLLRSELKTLLELLQNARAQATVVRVHAAVDLSTILSPKIAGQELALNQDVVVTEDTRLELTEGLSLQITPASARDPLRRTQLQQVRHRFEHALARLSGSSYTALAHTKVELHPNDASFAWLHQVDAELERDLQRGQEIAHRITTENARLHELEVSLVGVTSEEIQRAWQLHDQSELAEEHLPRQRGLFDPPSAAEQAVELDEAAIAQLQRRVSQLRNQLELLRKHIERDERDFYALSGDLAKLDGQIQSLAGGDKVDLAAMARDVEKQQLAVQSHQRQWHEAGRIRFDSDSGAVGEAMEIERAQAFLAQREAEMNELERLETTKLMEIQRNRQQQEHCRGSMAVRFRQDLEVQAARAQASLRQLESALAQSRRKLAALQLLKAKLDQLNSSRAANLAAPLQSKLAPSLERLFGVPTQVVFDSQYVPIQLRRNIAGEWHSFAVKELSIGTREQLALLVRIAYADVLREAGAASLLVFDDVLAYSDPVRQQQFADVLTEAAQRHQIILLSCNSAHWSSLARSAHVHRLGLP